MEVNDRPRTRFDLYRCIILFGLSLCLLVGNAQELTRDSLYQFCLQNSFENTGYKDYWINQTTIIEDSGKNRVSRIDKSNPYSAGLETDLPFVMTGKNLNLSISAAVLSAEMNLQTQCVISAFSKDSSVFWQGTPVHFNKDDPFTWKIFNTSIRIPQSIPVDTRFKIYFWNANLNREVHIDNIIICFTEIKSPSYLPD